MADMYGDETYWENRYAGPNAKEQFDFYHRYSGLKEYLTPYLKKEDLVLNLGCGTSRLAEEMYDDGFERVISIDFSATAVKIMSDKCRHKRDEFKYVKMDAKKIEFEEGYSFDLVIDKGTLDCILCGEGSVNNVKTTLKQIYNVLNHRGVFFCVSHGAPDRRLHYLKNPEFKWEIKTEKFLKIISDEDRKEPITEDKEPDYVYIYICTKKPHSSNVKRGDMLEP